MSDDLFNMLGTQPNSEASDPSAPFRLEITSRDNIVDVTLRLEVGAERAVANFYHNGVIPDPHPILRLDYNREVLSVFPISLFRNQAMYAPKYKRIREIQMPFEHTYPEPATKREVIDFVDEQMYPGFIKDMVHGLGFNLDMRPLVRVVEELPAVSRLVISNKHPTGAVGDTFYFTEGDFDHLRRHMGRIIYLYRQESLRDRAMAAHNATLHKIDPKKYPLKERPYEQGTVFKLLGGTRSGQTILKGRDRKGLVDAVAGNAKAIAKRDPKEFIQLQKDIELVSLDMLIDGFRRRLNRNASEATWQKLLELNPFVLTLLFGYPVVSLQGGASVGGQRLDGGGTKIADFLTKNPLTHNAAIVELKRPDTALLAREYRGSVYPPSYDLLGSITQVLDQRLKLVTDIPGIKHRNRTPDLEVFAVDCVVVAGRLPTEPDQLSSFELMRSQFKDVQIITFDELLERLHLLREMLAGERYVSEVRQDEPDEFDLDFEEHTASESGADLEELSQEFGALFDEDDVPF